MQVQGAAVHFFFASGWGLVCNPQHQLVCWHLVQVLASQSPAKSFFHSWMDAFKASRTCVQGSTCLYGTQMLSSQQQLGGKVL